MKEEELIKKLKNVKLPDIKLQSHQSRLRMALLDAGYPQKQRGVAFWELAKSGLKGVKETMIKGLISRQPVWKTATFGIVALVLVLGLSLTIPTLTTDSVYAQTMEVAQNSPELQAAFGDEGFRVVQVIMEEDGSITIIAEGEAGIIAATVDLETENVSDVAVLFDVGEVPEGADFYFMTDSSSEGSGTVIYDTDEEK